MKAKSICYIRIAALCVFSLSIALMPVAYSYFCSTFSRSFLYVNSVLFWCGLLGQVAVCLFMKYRKINFSVFHKLYEFVDKHRKELQLLCWMAIIIVLLLGLFCFFVFEQLKATFILFALANIFTVLSFEILGCAKF